jgi:hypothetical protein
MGEKAVENGAPRKGPGLSHCAWRSRNCGGISTFATRLRRVNFPIPLREEEKKKNSAKAGSDSDALASSGLRATGLRADPD